MSQQLQNVLPWARKFSSFALIGGGVFVIGQLLMTVLVEGAYWAYSPAFITQLVVTFRLNYWLNNKYTWTVATDASLRRFIILRLAILLPTFMIFRLLLDTGMQYLLASILVIVGGMTINFVLLEWWVFSARKHTKSRSPESLKLTRWTALKIIGIAATTVVLLGIGTGKLFVPLLLVTLSVMALVSTVMLLWAMLYAHRHAHSAVSLKPAALTAEPHESFAILTPLRQETLHHNMLLNAAWTQRKYRRFCLVPVIRDDDPDTVRIALAAARTINSWWAHYMEQSLDVLKKRMAYELDSFTLDGSPLTAIERAEINTWWKAEALVQIVLYPSGPKSSKPLQLNYGFRKLKDRFSAFSILDAESLAAQDLLFHFNQELCDHPDVDIVQGGVQLVPPTLTGTRGQKLRQYLLRWFSWHNLLEYYRCFSSEMPRNSDAGYLPLGGNTVVVRTSLLVKTDGWPETLTEDCALGTKASALHGSKSRTFYDPALATLEETPPNIRSLVRQRIRWNQGFLQTLIGGEWRALPTFRQRLLGLWVLSGAFLQALSAALLPVALVSVLLVKSSPFLVLIMYLPVAAMIVGYVLQLKQLHEFSVAYNRKVAWHVYVLVAITMLIPLYQWVLGFAAFCAVVRQVKGNLDWLSPDRGGDHMQLSSVPAEITR